jgi:hypothetical protein
VGRHQAQRSTPTLFGYAASETVVRILRQHAARRWLETHNRVVQRQCEREALFADVTAMSRLFQAKGSAPRVQIQRLTKS